MTTGIEIKILGFSVSFFVEFKSFDLRAGQWHVED